MSAHTDRERRELLERIAEDVLREVCMIAKDPETFGDFKKRFTASLKNQVRFFEDRVSHPEKALSSLFAHLGYALETVVKDPQKILGLQMERQQGMARVSDAGGRVDRKSRERK